MKYLYKNTGVVVESSVELDSSIFTPYVEPDPTAETEEKKAAPAQKKTTPKRTTARKTTGRTTSRSKKG
ncbi:MAG: hypothetical protein MJ116_02880 [Lachnospiraceae bacterium]|nr:hypothetical protein [Lachnospiraceae bacterium]